uniref:Silicatein-alpha interactor silintaphin-2 n=1 Tax=Suberites domuncula TaxID=55567 RepID=G0LDE9_SUBDO|nr:silicatein-alpha interactor silintaphin-2 [Suberites domuncula]
MKIAIFVLAFIAVTASVAYAAPQGEEADIEDADIEALLKRIMKEDQAEQQDDDSQGEIQSDMAEEEDDDNVDVQSFLAQVQADDEDEALLQALLNQDKVGAKAQWRLFRRVGRFVRKGVRFYRKYGKYGKLAAGFLGR